MRSERRGAAVALLAVALGGCSPPTDDCADNESCGFTEAGTGGSGGAGGVGGSGGSDGGGGMSGASGSGGSAGEGGACDTTKSPSEEVCLVSDAYAVFVDGTAASSGSGTKASPFKTIGEALTAAGTKNVLVCNTTYDEQVKITAGVKVYGGFACADWAYKAGERPAVKPSAKGHALEVGAAGSTVVIADMDFTAQAGTAPGESSIAAFVKSSSDVTLSRVKLEAGKGIDGTAGTLTAFAFPSEPTLRGNAASLLAGGAAKSYTSCPGSGSSTGGKGGGGGATPQDGDPGLPNYGGGGGGKGGGAICSAGTIGGSGTNGPDGNGASTVGKITMSGWVPGDGEPGDPGLPGQGGGGGGGDAGGGGGGGGAGACGGAGATGGGAGGSSIALLSFSSTVALNDAVLVTANAGNGGTSTAGQAGQGVGGNGGLPDASGGCQGGKGGPGGSGGAGGGAAGGVSVGVAYQGTKPVLGNTTITTGTAGAKGIGGKPGLNDGVPGAKEDLLQVQ